MLSCHELLSRNYLLHPCTVVFPYFLHFSFADPIKGRHDIRGAGRHLQRLLPPRSLLVRPSEPLLRGLHLLRVGPPPGLLHPPPEQETPADSPLLRVRPQRRLLPHDGRILGRGGLADGRGGVEEVPREERAGAQVEEFMLNITKKTKFENVAIVIKIYKNYGYTGIRNSKQ